MVDVNGDVVVRSVSQLMPLPLQVTSLPLRASCWGYAGDVTGSVGGVDVGLASLGGVVCSTRVMSLVMWAMLWYHR